MNRRKFVKSAALLAAASSFQNLPAMPFCSSGLQASDFGRDFLWGAATAAYQIEGGWNLDGKGASIWDAFTESGKQVDNGDNGQVACDFYHRYHEDIGIVRALGMDVFRFSLSWSRLFPDGIGSPNQAGFDFYNRVIDSCMEQGVQPWITCYHWDLPEVLEERGGWRNREVVGWFESYVEAAARAFGDRVKHWMVLNEPLAFTLLGYGAGIHAPGKRGWRKFCKASHHTAMAQAAGGRVLRAEVPEGVIGSTFSTSTIDPVKPIKREGNGLDRTVRNMDAIINRLFLEPALGMGYPFEDAPALKRMRPFIQEGDMDKLAFDFDFHGLQNYTRVVAKRLGLVPWFHGLQEDPSKRENEGITEMNWEIYPEGIYHQLKQFGAYPGIRKIIVTENGAAFPDVLEDGRVHDAERVEFYQKYLRQVLRAKQEGVPVEGYFAWSLLDNFEWAEGYRARFGLVYVDFESQKRYIKDSGFWFQELLRGPGEP